MATTSSAAVGTRLAPRTAARRRGAPLRRYLNRELSWLDFNERVLDLALDREMPALERARFLSIFASNLDEFYLVRFAMVKVPPLLGRFASPADGVYVPLEDVIAANLDRLFPGMRIVEHHAFRVTRNADLEVDDDGAEDLLEALEETLRKRRFSPAVRLEVEDGMPEHILELLIRELQVQPSAVHRLPGPLDLAGILDLYP